MAVINNLPQKGGASGDAETFSGTFSTGWTYEAVKVGRVVNIHFSRNTTWTPSQWSTQSIGTLPSELFPAFMQLIPMQNKGYNWATGVIMVRISTDGVVNFGMRDATSLESPNAIGTYISAS